MKKTLYILMVVALSVFFSCGQANEKNDTNSIVVDTIITNIDLKEKERLVKRKQIEEQDQIDSIRLDKVLKDALQFAIQNFDKEKFHYKYEVMPDSIPINVDISLNYHFTRAKPHLIIRRNEPSAVYIDIYAKNENQFEKVLSHEQWIIEYVNDTIRDINGDGLRDFVVNWYGSTGCCLKGFSNVYLLRPDKNAFSSDFRFINPTFSPTEKVIRGICYGHPGETEMYKYKWNREKIDTLEYISYQKNDQGVKTGKVIISKGRPYGDNYRIEKIINSVPMEYRRIEGYDWFTGEGYD